jgi:hypothetical protein
LSALDEPVPGDRRRPRPPGWARVCVTQDEIKQAFADGWHVEAIEPADINVTVRAQPARSWFASIARA